MYRILHISDIHRSPDDPMDNHALLSALDRDFESHQRENPKIGSIDAVILSGDIIQGVGLGAADHIEKLGAQYETAEEFLREFSDRYLDSDRARIIVVPGNHDVNWNTARSAMIEVPEKDQDLDLRKYLTVPHTRFRFCWRTRTLYYIDDLELYEKRFDQFQQFVRAFYTGANLSYPLQNSKYFNLFELAKSQIVVAGFNSCGTNDCYNMSACIPDGIIGKAYFGIKDSNRDYKLRIAVWHHSAHGPPLSTDYMDAELLREMASKHFQLGFHGHQHRTEVYPQTVFLPTREKMTVISAGSLCVGAKELPSGELRQYNIVEIDDDFSNATIHVREMVVERAFGPRRLASFGGKSFLQVKIDQTILPSRGKANRILAAEELVASRDYDGAIEVLREEVDTSVHARQLLLHAATEGQLIEVVITHFDNPQSISELLAFVDALESSNRFDDAREILSQKASELSLPNTQLQEILQRLAVNERIRNV